MQIRGYTYSDEFVKEVGKFAMLWNWFEKTYCLKDAIFDNIIKACGEINIGIREKEKLARVLNERREDMKLSIEDYINRALYPSKRNKSTAKQYIVEYLKQNESSVLNAGCLFTIQRIRNNLMHGEKDFMTLDTQIHIFKAANDVLESIRQI